MKDTEQNEFEITRGMYIAVRSLAFALGLLMLFFVGRAAITFCLGLFADGDHLVQFPGQESPIVSVQDIDTKPKPVYIDPSQLVEVSRADITVAGDLMLHLPIVRSGEVNGGYNFDDIFTFVKPYISAADSGNHPFRHRRQGIHRFSQFQQPRSNCAKCEEHRL